MFEKSLNLTMSVLLITLALSSLASAQIEKVTPHFLLPEGEQLRKLLDSANAGHDTVRISGEVPAFREKHLPLLTIRTSKAVGEQTETADASPQRVTFENTVSPDYRGYALGGHRNRLGRHRPGSASGGEKAVVSRRAAGSENTVSPDYRGYALGGHRNRLGRHRPGFYSDSEEAVASSGTATFENTVSPDYRGYSLQGHRNRLGRHRP